MIWWRPAATKKKNNALLFANSRVQVGGTEAILVSVSIRYSHDSGVSLFWLSNDGTAVVLYVRETRHSRGARAAFLSG